MTWIRFLPAAALLLIAGAVPQDPPKDDPHYNPVLGRYHFVNRVEKVPSLDEMRRTFLDVAPDLFSDSQSARKDGLVQLYDKITPVGMEILDAEGFLTPEMKEQLSRDPRLRGLDLDKMENLAISRHISEVRERGHLRGLMEIARQRGAFHFMDYGKKGRSQSDIDGTIYAVSKEESEAIKREYREWFRREFGVFPERVGIELFNGNQRLPDPLSEAWTVKRYRDEYVKIKAEIERGSPEALASHTTMNEQVYGRAVAEDRRFKRGERNEAPVRKVTGDGLEPSGVRDIVMEGKDLPKPKTADAVPSGLLYLKFARKHAESPGKLMKILRRQRDRAVLLAHFGADGWKPWSELNQLERRRVCRDLYGDNELAKDIHHLYDIADMVDLSPDGRGQIRSKYFDKWAKETAQDRSSLIQNLNDRVDKLLLKNLELVVEAGARELASGRPAGKERVETEIMTLEALRTLGREKDGADRLQRLRERAENSPSGRTMTSLIQLAQAKLHFERMSWWRLPPAARTRRLKKLGRKMVESMTEGLRADLDDLRNTPGRVLADADRILQRNRRTLERYCRSRGSNLEGFKVWAAKQGKAVHHHMDVGNSNAVLSIVDAYVHGGAEAGAEQIAREILGNSRLTNRLVIAYDVVVHGRWEGLGFELVLLIPGYGQAFGLAYMVCDSIRMLGELSWVLVGPGVIEFLKDRGVIPDPVGKWSRHAINGKEGEFDSVFAVVDTKAWSAHLSRLPHRERYSERAILDAEVRFKRDRLYRHLEERIIRNYGEEAYQEDRAILTWPAGLVYEERLKQKQLEKAREELQEKDPLAHKVDEALGKKSPWTPLWESPSDHPVYQRDREKFQRFDEAARKALRAFVTEWFEGTGEFENQATPMDTAEKNEKVLEEIKTSIVDALWPYLANGMHTARIEQWFAAKAKEDADALVEVEAVDLLLETGIEETWEKVRRRLPDGDGLQEDSGPGAAGTMIVYVHDDGKISVRCRVIGNAARPCEVQIRPGPGYRRGADRNPLVAVLVDANGTELTRSKPFEAQAGEAKPSPAKKGFLTVAVVEADPDRRNRPIEGATVRLDRPKLPAKRTGRNGVATFELKDGAVRITATKDGYESKVVAHEMNRLGDKVIIRLRKLPQGEPPRGDERGSDRSELIIRVYSTDGKVVKHVYMEVFHDQRLFEGRPKFDAERGAYVLRILSAKRSLKICIGDLRSNETIEGGGWQPWGSRGACKTIPFEGQERIELDIVVRKRRD